MDPRIKDRDPESFVDVESVAFLFDIRDKLQILEQILGLKNYFFEMIRKIS